MTDRRQLEERYLRHKRELAQLEERVTALQK